MSEGNKLIANRNCDFVQKSIPVTLSQREGFGVHHTNEHAKVERVWKNNVRLDNYNIMSSYKRTHSESEELL